MNVNERGRRIRELLGGTQDWPDGHSTFKIWFRDGKPLGGSWTPSDTELVEWCISQTGGSGHMWATCTVNVTPLVFRSQLTWTDDNDAAAVVHADGPTPRDALEQLVINVAQPQ